MATIQFTARSGDTVTLAGSPAELEYPDNGYGFAFSANEDWYATGDSKSRADERPAADGAFGILRDWRPALPLRIPGWYKGPDRASVRAARRLLQKVLANGANVDIRFIDGDEDTMRGLSVRALTPSNSSGNYFTFVLNALALDPLAYGATEVIPTGMPASGGGLLFPLGTNPAAYWDFGADGASGRVSVTNDGTAESFPLVRVTGGLGGGFIVTDITAGRTVSIARDIPVGSTVTVNSRTGSVTIDNQGDISGTLTSYGFFSILPGDTHVFQISPIGTVTGTPQFTIIQQDAYL